MKVITITLACLLAFASAVPLKQEAVLNDIHAAARSGDSKLVVSVIVAVIDQVLDSIRDAGYDPLNIESQELEYALPVPSIFNVQLLLRDFLLRGVTDLVINSMNYATLTFRLTFNVQLPQITLGAGLIQWDLKFFDRQLYGSVSGGLALRDTIITGDVRLGLISGIRSLDLTLSLGGIDSNLHTEVQGVDISQPLNQYLGKSLPGTLKAYEDEISELLSIVVFNLLS